ncbi:MAG: type IV pilus biogenesis/stability protein PilW [Pseudomonadota bacterium]
MIKRMVLLGGLLLAGCTQVVVEDSSRKLDPRAAARDRVAIAAKYIQQNEDDNALKYLQQALRSDPESAEAHNLLAVVMERDRNYKAADREFRKALRLRDNYSQAHNNYGSFLFRQGRYKAAMKQYEAAAEDITYSFRAQAFEGMARCAWQLGDREGTEDALQRALGLDPNLPGAMLLAAESNFEKQNYDVARNLYRRYLQLSAAMPQTPQSLWLGIRLERRFGDKDALASYELALKRLYPASPEYQQYLQTLSTNK